MVAKWTSAVWFMLVNITGAFCEEYCGTAPGPGPQVRTQGTREIEAGDQIQTREGAGHGSKSKKLEHK